MKIYPVFHVSLLESDQGSNDMVEPLPPILHVDVEEYKVEQVLDSKINTEKLHYKVAWTGYPNVFNEWVDISAMTNATELVEEFHSRNPEKLGPQQPAVSVRNPRAGLRLRPRRPLVTVASSENSSVYS